jgi:uncharacterized membrane protein
MGRDDPPDEINRTAERTATQAAMCFVVFGFTAAYGAMALLQHWHFNSSYDLAIYDQAVWHLSRFEAPASSVRGMTNLFGDHFHPVIVLFTPLFWLVPAAETLLTAQALLLAISIIPVFAYSRDRLPRGAAVAIAVAYGLFWGMQQTAAFDVHEAAFAPVAIASLILAMERRQWRWFYIAAVTVVAVKEDLSPFLAWVGGYLFVRGERRRGALLSAASLTAFIVIVGFVIPSASDSGLYGYRGTYEEVLSHPFSILVRLVNPPIKMVTACLWVAPFAALPLASPLSVLLVPFGIEHFLSSSPNHWGTIFHYSAPLAPIVAMAAADGLARIRSRVRDASFRSRMTASFAAIVVLLAALLPGRQPLWRLFSPAFYHVGVLERAGRDALRLIPADASVVAQTNLTPHLSHRSSLYRLDSEAPDADYVIAVDGRSPWPLANFQDIRSLLDERQRRGYGVVFEREGWIVLQRTR